MTGIPTTPKEFTAWVATNRDTLNADQLWQAEYMEQSFKGLAMNKNNPDALPSMQRDHDAGMEKLKTLLAGN